MSYEYIELLCMGCFARLESKGIVCPYCDFDEKSYEVSPYRLPLRTILGGKYMLGKVLGEGGFGITYIGYDLNLDIKVAVKEFFPSGFVMRATTISNTIQPLSTEQGDIFAKGRDRFVDEAKRLARFRVLPGIVMVSDFVSENGTAYIVMEYVEGQTLKKYAAQMGGKLPPGQVVELLSPIFSSLAQIHESGIIHRDISPDNIMLTPNGSVKLLDFGAAREFDDENKSLSVMLKHGYAPSEQYSTRGEQGSHTDVYALSATIYKVITGITPENAMDRILDDRLEPPGKLGIFMKADQEAALMKGLAVRHQDRYKTVSDLHTALQGTEQIGTVSQLARAPIAAPQPVAAPPATYYPISPGTTPQGASPAFATPVKQPPASSATSQAGKIIGAIVAACAVLVVILFLAIPRPENTPPPPAPAPAPTEPAVTPSPEPTGTPPPAVSQQPPNTGDNNQQESITDDNDATDSPQDTVSVGGIIEFGGYDWRVLDIQDDRALIISEMILEDRAYHETREEITWEHSDMRHYLNNDYYNSFNGSDRVRIVEAEVINSDNSFYETVGGNNTVDKVFLLSIDEVHRFLPTDTDRIAHDEYGESSWWWLRSPGFNSAHEWLRRQPGSNSDSAAYVSHDGHVNVTGRSVNVGDSGVRPALWLNLES